MANIIKPKRTSVAGNNPTTSNLASGEIAVNMADKRIFINNGTSIVQIAAGYLSGLGDVSLSTLSTGQTLSWNGTAWTNSSAGAGDVVGAASSTDNAIVRFDGTTGKLIQNSAVTIDDAGNIINPDSIQFSGTVPATQPVGTLWFDTTNDTLNLQQNNITQQIGEELFIYGKASAAITNGQLVCKTGAVGASGVITFAPSPANLTDNDGIIGVATEDIALNAFGRITSFGVVHGINTTGASVGETWADGDTLWYNPAGSGKLTNAKPTAPNIKYQIGTVTHAGSGGSGSIQVTLVAGSVLGGTDSNVNLSAPSNGQILTYDTSNTYWKNTTLTAGTAISISAATGGALTITNTAPDQTVVMSGTSPISVTGTYPNFTVSMTQSSGSVNGWLSSTDWTTFNSKQAAYTNLTSIGSLANGSGWLKNNGTGTFSYSTPTYSDVGAPSTSGTGATGTWSISISGNAATVTNGVYTTGDQSIAGNKTFSGETNPSGGLINGSRFNKSGTGGEGGELHLEKGTTSTLSADLVFDLYNQSIRFFENGGTNRGASLDISAQSASVGSTILTNTSATSGSSILSGNGSGGFSNVTIGSGLSFSAGTLSASGSGTVTSVGGTGTVAGISLSGTVTSSGNLTLGGTFALPSGQVPGKMIYDTFTATASQTTFTPSTTYTSGKIEVYVNGVKMRNGTDVTVTSGTSVVFATGLAVGSLVDLVYPI